MLKISRGYLTFSCHSRKIWNDTGMSLTSFDRLAILLNFGTTHLDLSMPLLTWRPWKRKGGTIQKVTCCLIEYFFSRHFPILHLSCFKVCNKDDGTIFSTEITVYRSLHNSMFIAWLVPDLKHSAQKFNKTQFIWKCCSRKSQSMHKMSRNCHLATLNIRCKTNTFCKLDPMLLAPSHVSLD